MPWVSRPVKISAAQRKELMAIAKSNKSSHKEKMRALLVLLLGEGLKNKEICERLKVHENTVVKWRGRWSGDNSDAKVMDYGELTGRPRNVLVPKTLEKIKRVANGKSPKGQTRWTVRSLAAQFEMSVATMQRALKELDIQLGVPPQ